MSAVSQAPPVLARRGNQSTRGKTSDSGASRPGTAKDKSSTEKAGETAKSETAKPSRTRTHNEGEKLVLRRLPPGMTQEEVLSILGPEYELGNGKIDWLSFSPGKISNDPAKPSRPGRMNIHLLRKDDIMPLTDLVRSATWEDAKGSFTSNSLIGPPVVEFAIYKKIPSNRKRTDARQGTIDQDPEFMAFLEDLANPAAPKESVEAEDTEDNDKVDTKITSTPLTEYLKEKRANKGKELSSGKGSKGSSVAKGKGSSKDDDPSTSKKRGKGSKDDKVPKETVKILTKKATATEQAAEAAKNAASQITAAASTADAPKSRRAGIAAAAKILQRDLGLSPGSAHRRARQDAAKADPDPKTSAASENAKVAATAATGGGTVPVAERPSSPAPSDAGSQTSKATAASKAPRQRNRGGRGSDKTKGAGADTSAPQTPTATNPPILLKKGDTEPSIPAILANTKDAPEAEPTAAATPAKPAAKGSSKQGGQGSQKKLQQAAPPSVTAGATRGFVKHASASQGVTEDILRQTLSGMFGEVTSVEHDKRKGFAYVDFAKHDSLVKAIAAGSLAVGQAKVQVLERKDKKPATDKAAPSASSSQVQQQSGAANPAASGASPENGDKEKPASSGRSRRGRGRGGGGGGGAGGGGNKNAGVEKRQGAQATPSTNGGGGSGSGAG